MDWLITGIGVGLLLIGAYVGATNKDEYKVFGVVILERRKKSE